MLRRMLKSKIQDIRVTGTELHYTGSLAMDQNMLEAADILAGESVHVYNLTNGNRLETYAIAAPRGSGTVSVKGAAAHLLHNDDRILVVSFADYSEDELADYHNKVVYVDENNQVTHVDKRRTDDEPTS